MVPRTLFGKLELVNIAELAMGVQSRYITTAYSREGAVLECLSHLDIFQNTLSTGGGSCERSILPRPRERLQRCGAVLRQCKACESSSGPSRRCAGAARQGCGRGCFTYLSRYILVSTERRHGWSSDELSSGKKDSLGS